MVIVVTGSNGKTTTLHLLESQLQQKARYSHFANSAFGIPFDILGINRIKFSKLEWLKLFSLAPLKAFKKPFKQSIYVAEADCDRPHEGAFLAKLLKPTITIWLSSARTHSYNFDRLVKNGKFQTVEEAIAYEYGHHIENTSELVIVNSDHPLIDKQLRRTTAKVIKVSQISQLQDYQVDLKGTNFKIDNQIYKLPFLLPAETFYSITATIEIVKKLALKFDYNFSKLIMPPGRSSIFQGIKNTTIIDSSYNANYDSVSAILNTTQKITADQKWLILGDLLELGEEEEEYNKLATLLVEIDFKKIILVGPRLNKRILENLKSNCQKNCQVSGFIKTIEAQEFLKKSIKGKELLIFKASGSQAIEKIIEELLSNKEDLRKLCRH